jgi:hypothetical protein
MFLLCVIFEDINIGLPVIALNPQSRYILEKSKVGYIKYKPIQANVTAHVLTAQVKNISIFLKQYLNNTNNIYVYDTIARNLYSICVYLNNLNSVTSQIVYFTSLFIFNYIYNTVYYHRLDRIIENMKNNICYIRGVRINNIAYYMSMASAKCAFLAIIMTILLMLTPKCLSYIVYTNITLSPIDLMIITSAFMHFKQFLARIFTYYEFKINMENISYRK